MSYISGKDEVTRQANHEAVVVVVCAFPLLLLLLLIIIIIILILLRGLENAELDLLKI